MRTRILAVLLLSLLASTAVLAQEQNAYETLLEKVKKEDQSVNFQSLRFAYTETKLYSPYGGDREARKGMFTALNAKDYERALKHSEKILGANYVDIGGHFVAYVAHKELANAEKARYHEFIFQSLLKSITESGDGKTLDKAFVVISTDEEYTLLNFLGMKPTAQALLEEKGHRYDRMTTVNAKTGETVVYYFNIDKPFNWLGQSLKQ